MSMKSSRLRLLLSQTAASPAVARCEPHQMQPRCAGSSGVRSVVVQVAPPSYVMETYMCQPAFGSLPSGSKSKQLVLRVAGLVERRLGDGAEEGDGRAAVAAGDHGRHRGVLDPERRAEVDSTGVKVSPWSVVVATMRLLVAFSYAT